MTAPAILPAPTCRLGLVIPGLPEAGNGTVGVDLVTDVVGDLVTVLVCTPGAALAFRLQFTLPQLGAFMDDLVDCADVAEQGAELAASAELWEHCTGATC